MLLVKRFVAAVAVGICMPAAVQAQSAVAGADAPETAPVRLGPVALAPTLSVTNLGWDSNVFQQADGTEVGDFTAITSPRVQGWLRVGRVRVRGRASLDFFYFQDHASERSVDSNYEGRLDLSLGRLTAYTSGTWVDAKQLYGFEVDDRIRRHETSATGGAVLEIGPRTSLDVAARRRRAEFGNEANFQDPLISEFDDYTSQGLSASFRHDLSPYTSVAMTVDEHQDRFDEAPDRDTNNIGIDSGVDFRPVAMVGGHAYVGWVRVQMVNGESPPFGALTLAVDLTYVLLGATKFVLQAERSVEYSAIRNQDVYLMTGITGTVNHRFGEKWDAGGRFGHYRLTYGLFEDSADSSGSAPESGADPAIVRRYGGEVGYRVGPSMRVAFGLYQQDRRSMVTSVRDYQRTVAAMSVNYIF
jgi:hypothetical protein